VRIGKKKFVREKRLLKVEELRAILAALPDHLRFLVLILFGLGLRISEALALRWKDIDFGQAVVNLQRRWYRGDLSAEMKNESSAAALRLSATLATNSAAAIPARPRTINSSSPAPTA
jgi:integrase